MCDLVVLNLRKCVCVTMQNNEAIYGPISLVVAKPNLQLLQHTDVFDLCSLQLPAFVNVSLISSRSLHSSRSFFLIIRVRNEVVPDQYTNFELCFCYGLNLMPRKNV